MIVCRVAGKGGCLGPVIDKLKEMNDSTRTQEEYRARWCECSQATSEHVDRRLCRACAYPPPDRACSQRMNSDLNLDSSAVCLAK